MKKVAYIVKAVKNGKYRLFMADAVEMEGDDDSVLNVTMTGPQFESLDEAQKTLRTDHDTMLFNSITPYYTPIESNDSGISWLSELLNVNKELSKQ